MERNKMKLQIASDLHLERRDNYFYLLNNPIEPKGDILVLAGDICNIGRENNIKGFFDDVKSKFKTVIYIPGNHEYYGTEFNENSVSFLNQYENLVSLNNCVHVEDDVRFICSTLWSGVSEYTTNGINDYFAIASFDKITENIVHRKCKDFIIAELERPFEGKTVVVSHHLPLLQCIDHKYKDNPLNDAFASDQSNIFKNYQIDLWIHGHTHGSIDFAYEGTRVVCNPLGYCRGAEYTYKENNEFKHDFEVEL
jgi:3',5'-cyclic AMP phosphodiesterase CpdA